MNRILRSVNNRAWVGFLVVCVVIGLSLAPRLWALRLLYTDAEMREQVERSMRLVASSRGWLLSDIELRAVTETGMSIHHRLHGRGPDPRECWFVTYEPFELFSCAL